MSIFKLARLSRKSAPVVASNESLDAWSRQARTQSSRFVQKVEMCTAHAAGDDAWGTPIGKNHHHTLLRVSLAPGLGASEETFLLERVLSTGEAYHSVAPVEETFTTSGTLFHPDVHDRVSILSDGPSAAHAPRLVVERTLTFGDYRSSASQNRLTLAQLAQILAFVSRMTMLICDGGDCGFQTRSFAFTCLAALAPSVPPRQAGEVVGAQGDYMAETVDDSVYELSAEAFLCQTPWLAADPASMEALTLIKALKDEPRERAKARLYH